MKRPYVICHMASTVDGKIIAERWGSSLKKYTMAYEECHESYQSQAWMVGRVTMEKDFTEGHRPTPAKAGKTISRSTFIADEEATWFAIAVDPKGKLGWKKNEIDGDHIIEILSDTVRNRYLQYLQNKKVSYVIAGKSKINFKVALERLHKHFGIKRLMLEGGGHVNGSLLNAKLVDEISVLIIPIADGAETSPTTFEITSDLPKKPATHLKLSD